MYNLADHLNNLQTFQYGKLNLFNPVTKTSAVLSDINENNFKQIIEEALKTIFNSKDHMSVKFVIDNKLVYFKDLQFDNLKDLEHGHIFNLLI